MTSHSILAADLIQRRLMVRHLDDGGARGWRAHGRDRQAAQQPTGARRHVQGGRRPRAHRAVVRDRKGRFVPGPDGARFRGARRAASRGRSPTSVAISRASASRCCSTSAAAWKARAAGRARSGGARAELARPRRATRRRSSRSTRGSTRCVPFTSGPARAARRRWRRSCRSARRRCTTRSRRRRARVGGAKGRRRAVVVLTDGNDNASRLTPAEVSAHRERASTCRSTSSAIVPPIDNPSATSRLASAERRPSTGRWRISRRGPAGTSSWRARRPQRSVAARQIVDELRHQYLHRVRIERHAGLASARGPRAEQGPDRTGPERIHRGAISPGRRVEGGSIMFRKFFVAVVARGRWSVGGSTACATKKFVRTSVGEVNDKVDSLGRVGRGDAGAHAQERRADRRSRPEGRRRRRRPAQQANAAGGRRAQRPPAGDRGRRQGRRDRQGEHAARLRSRPERGPGQLQVRQDDAARRGEAEDRRDGRAAEAGSEEHLPRDRRAHRQRRPEGRSTRRSASSAPRR